VRVVNNLQADLQAVCPGLLEITGEASNQWFLNFLLSADTLPKLARLKRSTLLKIPSVGVKSAALIEGWQKRFHFSQEVDWVGEMIQEDAKRCLELDEKIKRLQAQIAEVAKDSKIAKTLRSIPGFGAVYFRVGRRDRHHRTVCLRGEPFFVSRHVHVGQQLGEVPGN
jgi:hypothetical protein